ncbi:hypothetical protein HDU81_009292 [Chytriomyces hyalinus]|nr:hypothetical protein HDU81_009292 [Chytriomyces hyalinus]
MNTIESTAFDELTQAEMRKVAIISSLGTLIEWYDFFIFGTMASTTASMFYKTGNPFGDLIAWLGAFAVGFMFRPFGAFLFGYIGDKVGRKSTFLITLSMMGASTFLVGCLPTYDTIGVTAGFLLILLRIIQGLSVGGEYGGAAAFICENCPQDQRGFYTSFLQMTAKLGISLSLLAIIVFKLSLGDAAWFQYGWRLPFLVSIFLVGLSIYVRYHLRESPMFVEAKRQGGVVGNPLVEAVCLPYNLYYMFVALVAVMGQGITFQTANFYALTFLQSTIKVPQITSYIIMLIALLGTIPFQILFGWMSDRVGRKPMILSGVALSAFFLYPLFYGVYACRPFEKNDPKQPFRENYDPVLICFYLWILNVFGAAAYSSMAAFLVELFPTGIRYTCVSIPYHIGNGIFGGLVPVVAVSISTATRNVFGGLFYPIGVCAFGFFATLLFAPETLGRDIRKMKQGGLSAPMTMDDRSGYTELQRRSGFMAAS